MRTLNVLCALSALSLVACDDGEVDPADSGVADTGVMTEDAEVPPADSGPDAGPGELVVPDTYTFESRFNPGESSIAHTGQTARHLLISDLKDYIGGLTDEVDGGFSPAADGDVTARLEYFFSLDGADRASDPFRLSTDPAPLQTSYGDISSANLIDKLAGNDTSTDHRDWSTEFVGWSDPAIAAHGGGVDTPTDLVRAFFETLEQNAIDRAAGVDRLSPALQPLPVHVTASGLDLQQLTEKFLLGALTFSQGADDYTDDDVDGKGLLVDNTMPASDGSPYTALEHVWDEAWGYFGAAEAYGSWTAESLSTGPRYMDVSGDGAIDLGTEYNWGASVNAAKRDDGAAVATDFMGQAFLAFRTGRAMIAHHGELDADERAALTEQRDLAIQAWEQAIAATVVHYINDTLQVMGDFGTPAYDHDRFLDHAKAWSEMKGFALMFQFNPRSPLSREQFTQLHTLMGDAPVLPAAGPLAADEYRENLRTARALLGAAYGFDAANLGDDDGNGGW